MSARPGSGGPKLRRLNMGQIFIILAVVSAVLTIFVFKSMMSDKTVQKVEAPKTKPLIVASQHLFPGEVLSNDSIKIVQWPEEQYPTESVYAEPTALIGRVLKNELYPGQPLYRQNLAGEDSRGGMPVLIPKGYRAMTVMVSENKGVAGFVKPGDHVDIIGVFEYQIPEVTQKALVAKSGTLLEDSFSISQTVLQDVQVLAIAQEMYEKKSKIQEGVQQGAAQTNQAAQQSAPAAPTEPPPPPARVVSSVTVAVTPEQAEKLAIADSKADLRLTLRPEDEHEEVHLIGALREDIVPLANIYEKAIQILTGAGMSIEEEQAPMPSVAEVPPALPIAPPPPPKREVQVIEGTTSTSVAF